MSATLRRAAGSVMVVGLGGAELTGLERAWLRLVRPAGIILFRRNIADAAQTRALLKQATSLCAANSLRCVDLEGGTVDRLRDALAAMPSAQAVARAARQPGKGNLARRHGELIAQSVKTFGFNTTLAPVLDLALPASAEVLGTRAVAPDPDGVIAYAHAFLAGLAAQGVSGCGKHFPGLGGGVRDSHQETPAIARAWTELWRDDLAPYRALCGELPMVMVNHAAYPATLGKNRPASVSSFWITTVLRRRIGYRGLVFSDDLEMGGILKRMSIEEAAIATLRAGMDLVEICHSPELILRAFEAIIAEGERSAAFRKLIEARARHTAQQRARLFANPASRSLAPRQWEALRARVLRFGQTAAKVGPAEARSA